MAWLLDPSWSLIFGGCCSNVFSLEAIVKFEPDSGLIITFSQFVIATICGLPTQLERREPNSPGGFFPWRLKRTVIPLRRLAVMGLMFFSVNMLNNWAFAFHIAVPMHIILRSFSSVTTMAVGWMWGKRYSRIQIASVVAMTAGVIISAWADADRKAKAKLSVAAALADPNRIIDEKATGSFSAGIFILFIAQIIAALMGIYAEQAYSIFGRHWQEVIFYSHALGLPLSLTFSSTLWHQFSRLLAGPRAFLPVRALSSMLPAGMTPSSFDAWQLRVNDGPFSRWYPSQAIVMLLLNVATQLACVSGVNLLSARSSAVTVTVVLNIRKLVSFLLSCIIFGNPVSPLLGFGASTVFLSGAIYGWDSSRRGKAVRRRRTLAPPQHEEQSHQLLAKEAAGIAATPTATYSGANGSTLPAPVAAPSVTAHRRDSVGPGWRDDEKKAKAG